MKLADEILQAQGCHTVPPPNEAAVCNWIILPLLHAAGYLPMEIAPQIKDQHHKIPDYTILPNTSFTWFLEAKGWTVPLEDAQVIQALNYANHNGKRWVVLSNGKNWRLYDNSVQGIAAEKLITDVALDDTSEMHLLLEAVSKESVVSGKVASYAAERLTEKRAKDRAKRIKSYLSSCLADPGSSLVAAITSHLALELNLQDLEPIEIVTQLHHVGDHKPVQPGPGSTSGAGKKSPPGTYPREWYASNRFNPDLIDDYFRLIEELKTIAQRRGWQVKTELRQGFASFKVGARIAFGIGWLNKNELRVFFSKLNPEICQALAPAGAGQFWFNEYKEGCFKLEPGVKTLRDFEPLMEASMNQLGHK